jgi:hypothetical protein
MNDGVGATKDHEASNNNNPDDRMQEVSAPLGYTPR